jgi:hypothetical protein
MARVAAVFDDLLLGSNILGMLKAAGHEATLTAQAPAPGEYDVVVVDLGVAGAAPLAPSKTIGVYSHVDVETRRQAEEAGFDLVVPRSRMAREGAELVARLLSAPPS